MSIYFFYEPSDGLPFTYLTPTRQVGPLPPPYESGMSPGEYLEFAIQDLASDTPRGLINAFSNAKRAFHLALDSLLNQYGLFAAYRQAAFPEKAAVIDAVGMIPVGIMRNLNVERNLLEHEYVVPSKPRVTEAVDVVRLLLLAMETLIEATPQEAVVGWREPLGHRLLQLEPQAGVLNYYEIEAMPDRIRTINATVCISGFRDLSGGGFLPGIAVSETACMSIPLDKAHHGEWLPVVRELVNVRRRNTFRSSHIDLNDATATIPVTIPLRLPDGASWHELISRALMIKATPQDPALTDPEDDPTP
jgi:hypothetical protein